MERSNKTLLIFFLSLFCSISLFSQDMKLSTSLHSSSLISFEKNPKVIKKAPQKLLKNQNSRFRRKFGRATALSTGYNLSIGAGLFLLPTSVTLWPRGEGMKNAGPNLKRAWTQEPVWDKDAFMVNYFGHPYQGGYYYGSLRSQGGKVWESALFCLGQTLLWEFGYEAIKEPPSKQDLITTPIGGVIYGELLHRSTLRMRRNGFQTWEKVIITIFNPSYVINNGYK